MIIPEGSKVTFKIDGIHERTGETHCDCEIENDSIAMIEGVLACTKSDNSVEKINDNEYVVNCYLQDAVGIHGSVVFDSTSNID